MPDITLPEIHLPDVKLPEGLRDVRRRDIQEAISGRLPTSIDLPDVDLSKIDLSKIDLSRVELPKAVEKRLPRRRRSNPILPIAAIVAIASLCAAAWWLITSPSAMIRVRETADRLRARVRGDSTELERYDDADHLGSLLPETDRTRPTLEAETWPDRYSDVGAPVEAGNGSSAERPAGV